MHCFFQNDYIHGLFGKMRKMLKQLKLKANIVLNYSQDRRIKIVLKK